MGKEKCKGKQTSGRGEGTNTDQRDGKEEPTSGGGQGTSMGLRTGGEGTARETSRGAACRTTTPAGESRSTRGTRHWASEHARARSTARPGKRRKTHTLTKITADNDVGAEAPQEGARSSVKKHIRNEQTGTAAESFVVVIFFVVIILFVFVIVNPAGIPPRTTSAGTTARPAGPWQRLQNDAALGGQLRPQRNTNGPLHSYFKRVPTHWP